MRTLILAVFLVACGSSQPKPTPTPEPTPEPMPHEPEAVPVPPSPSTVLMMGECQSLRVQGEPVPRGAPMPASSTDGGLMIWPATDCVQVEGWAGVSYSLWGLAGAFSGDGKSYLHCGNGTNACEQITVADGKVAKKLAAKGNMDTAPDGIFVDKGIAPTVKKLKLATTPGPWPDSAVIVSWIVTLKEETPMSLAFVAREMTTGAEVELARFEAPAASEGDEAGVILPESVTVAPDGKTLAFVARAQQGQSLTDTVTLVPVARALGEVYTAAAGKDPANADKWNAKRDALK